MQASAMGVLRAAGSSFVVQFRVQGLGLHNSVLCIDFTAQLLALSWIASWGPNFRLYTT